RLRSQNQPCFHYHHLVHGVDVKHLGAAPTALGECFGQLIVIITIGLDHAPEQPVVFLKFLAAGVGQAQGGVEVGDGESVLDAGGLAAQTLPALSVPCFQAVSVGGGQALGSRAVLLFGVGVGLNQVEA